jgi:hypothetical protein
MVSLRTISGKDIASGPIAGQCSSIIECSQKM